MLRQRVILAMGALFATVPAHAVVVTLHVYNFDFGTAAHVNSDPTIQLGDTVRWVWDTGFHTTTAAAGQAESWSSGFLSAPATFDHIFTHAGTFNYYCEIHGFDAGNGRVGGMSGSVRVVPEPATLAALGIGFIALRRRRRAV
jgi:plastocyanin